MVQRVITEYFVPFWSLQRILTLLPSRVITLRFGFFLYSSILNCFILFVFLFQTYDRSADNRPADIRITFVCAAAIAGAKVDEPHVIRTILRRRTNPSIKYITIMLFEYLIDFTSLKIHLQEFIFCSDLNSIGFCVFHIIVI